MNDGCKYGKCPAITVFTNLGYYKKYRSLSLKERFYDDYKNFTSENNFRYSKYDNFNAINVDRISYIPCDYFDIMGVPVTFLSQYCPFETDMNSSNFAKYFEILGLLNSSDDKLAGIPNLKYYDRFLEMRQDMSYTRSSGRKANGNPVIQGKSIKGNFLYNPLTNEYVHSLYFRILIRRKDQPTTER